MQQTARVYDSICIIHQLPTGFNTFGYPFDYVLNSITSNSSADIFLITGQYGIVLTDHSRQGRSGSIKITAIRPEQKLPMQQKKYLYLGSNKQ